MAQNWFVMPDAHTAFRACGMAEKISNVMVKSVFCALRWGVWSCLMVLLLFPSLFAAEVSLNWRAPLTNANGTVLRDLQGFIVNIGEQPGRYTRSIDVGNVTSYRVANLTAGRTYYFVVSAYDRSGNESRYSNEAGIVIPYTYTSSSIGDSDGDGIPDDGDGSGFPGDNLCSAGRLTNCDDNCALTANPFQQDTDSDGYGNACDCDLDNDSFVSTSDYYLFYAAMNSDPSSPAWNRDADFDSDGYIGINDYEIFSQRWMTRPPWD